ncbi:MAG TPA: HypC/HybG/HupF family hydrogenase formation chaperone [Solirubrobacteraceae bacterium]|nr:HypC/HybG/HupF family hydrogenase formation chaperone [Solirubrobacteraceae bacterium]
MSACDPHDPHCITCGDVAVEMLVVEVNDSLAVCEAEGEAREVEVALLEDVRAGDRLLVHADVGLVKLA